MIDNNEISPDRIPAHVGIIMDGNGRWAQNKGMPRTFGHKEGLKAAKRVVKAASELGIQYLSLYTFSTENWKRAEDEVSFLMRLIKTHLKKEYDFYRENKIRVVHSGNISKLPDEIIKEIEQVTKDTEKYPGLIVNLAINYGGRDEIIRAVRKWMSSDNYKSNNNELTEKTLSAYLDLPFIPDADLIIRTAGEKRLSNFLLWESAYSEFYFSPALWPDWDSSILKEAIIDYQKRHRRFGGLK